MRKVDQLISRRVPGLPRGSSEDKDGDLMLQTIQARFTNIKTTNKVENFIRFSIEGEWAASTHYLYKRKYNHSHKIPFKPINQYFELKGDVLLALLNLCLELHPTEMGGYYTNGAEWFAAIAWEIKRQQFEDSFNKDAKKTHSINKLRNLIDSYKCYENPHDPIKEIHQWRLVQAVIDAKNRGNVPTWLRRLWIGTTKKEGDRFHMRGLVDAMRKLATAYDKDPSFAPMFSEDGKIFIQSGRGKDNRILITDDSIKDIMSLSVHLKALHRDTFELQSDFES